MHTATTSTNAIMSPGGLEHRNSLIKIRADLLLEYGCLKKDLLDEIQEIDREIESSKPNFSDVQGLKQTLWAKTYPFTAKKRAHDEMLQLEAEELRGSLKKMRHADDDEASETKDGIWCEDLTTHLKERKHYEFWVNGGLHALPLRPISRRPI